MDRRSPGKQRGAQEPAQEPPRGTTGVRPHGPADPGLALWRSIANPPICSVLLSYVFRWLLSRCLQHRTDGHLLQLDTDSGIRFWPLLQLSICC